MNQYKEVLKEVASGVWTHSHWIDENGNVIESESMVIPATEYEQMKESISDMSAIIEDAIMRGVL